MSASIDLAFAVAYLIGWAVIAVALPGSAHARDVTLSFYYLPVYYGAAALSLYTSRRPGLERRTRRAWRLIACASLCTAIGDSAWLYFEVARGIEDAPFWVDLITLSGYPFWIAGLLTFPSAPRAATERARFWLDVATVAVGGSMLSWYFLLRPIAVATHSGFAATLMAMSFPIGDLAVLVSVAAILARAPTQFPRWPLRLIAASLVSQFIADLAYGNMRLAGTYHTGDTIDWIWLLSGTLLALAARSQARASTAALDSGAAPTFNFRARSSLLPYASVAAGFGLLIIVALPHFGTDIGDCIFGALLLTLLVVVRQVLAANENVRLLDERAAQEARFRHEALHDSLTGLANRALLRDRVDHALTRARRRQQLPLALIFLDLDNFKTVNDSLGHATGDALLVEAAHRLMACVRGTDTVARMGGDEFAIFIEDPVAASECTLITERILAALSRPFPIEGRNVFVGASLGVATARDTDSADDLLRNADVAMYMAKSRGKARCEFFAPEMQAQAVERMELEADLRQAVDTDQFVLHYQPIVILETGEITGVEALVRWMHPKRGLLAPGQFIGMAEETGVIVPIGRWVLREACRQASVWHARFGATGSLAMTVNISARQLHTAQLVIDVHDALRESGIDPHTLILELTESVLTEQTSVVLETLQALKALGVRLAIDDFGTGYSSLSYLQRFPIDILKIAKPFIDEVAQESGRHGLAQAIITLGSSLAVRTIAEGIEQPDQRVRLRALGCELGQGFHFSHPVTAEELDARFFGARRRSAAVPLPAVGVVPDTAPL